MEKNLQKKYIMRLRKRKKNNSLTRVVSIVGARPQFIEIAPLVKEFRKHNIKHLIHTGQHYDYLMNKVFFDDLQISEPKGKMILA